MKDIRIRKGKPYPLGTTVKNNGINFSMVNTSNEECGIILYQKATLEKERIVFEEQHKIGNISCLFMEGLHAEEYDYNFYIGENVIVDPYAKHIIGNEVWGGALEQELLLRGGFYFSTFDWQHEKPLHIPYHESIFYCLHVRSFTKHASSKVKYKGTFAGLTEKLPYLKELGITAVELMPVYEFEEYDPAEDTSTIEYQLKHYTQDTSLEESSNSRKLNYWGFKRAFYFSPKASYASSDNPCEEFKTMVREFHRNGIEIIMQFYFPDDVKQGYILEILKHWVLEYRIDGVHLKGTRIPVTLISTEPLFSNLKIMCEDFSLEDIYSQQEMPSYKNLGFYRDGFMYDTRRFLKGDSDMLKTFQLHMRNQNEKCGIINYMTNYYGFTMMDLVSYNRKHNEVNGEDNHDGTDYNYSWNCGAEGPTRKKSVLLLRKKQIRNAFCFLFTAQGAPLFMSGDEFGNTQNGNNNCYCQDNEVSWLNWNLLKKNDDIYTFVKDLITFRKAHPILHIEELLTLTDRFGYGYPDLSYHGEEAWKVQLKNYNHHLAMLYCGKYARKADKTEDAFIYIAYNMYWEPCTFALPSLPGKTVWETVMNTVQPALDTVPQIIAMPKDTGTCVVEVAPRSIMILIGTPEKKEKRSSR